MLLKNMHTQTHTAFPFERSNPFIFKNIQQVCTKSPMFWKPLLHSLS